LPEAQAGFAGVSCTFGCEMRTHLAKCLPSLALLAGAKQSAILI
jgi:hypothetical protein